MFIKKGGSFLLSRKGFRDFLEMRLTVFSVRVQWMVRHVVTFFPEFKDKKT